jgi:hypothetical protein
LYLSEDVGPGGIEAEVMTEVEDMTEVEIMTEVEAMKDIVKKERRAFMNQEIKDQGWQRIQSRIDQLVSQFLKEDYPAIEYKASIAGLLQLQPEYNEEGVEKIS